MIKEFERLAPRIKGELYFDNSPKHQTRLMAYATDASIYQEKPLAVVLPAEINDIKELIAFATQHKLTLIPRAAGTSLAGQVVGKGIVVDISHKFTSILGVNKEEKWVRVQPGVIRDDLNAYLRPYGLLFGPETSTASRAMIGGMVGNNSCGLHSIVWGAVRDHLLEVNAILSDGSEVVIKVGDHTQGHTGLKGKIYHELNDMLSNEHNQQLIKNSYPKKDVVRRNTGYALDALLQMQPYQADGQPFNLCSLIAGSEGTLAFITEVKLQLLDLPPSQISVVCIHTNSIDEALRANIVALKHKPMASELVDKFIMDFTINHPEYHKNRFFIEGDPAAILMVEFMADTAEASSGQANALINELQALGLGYAYPVLHNKDTVFAWDVRKAGLGLLRNIQGDAQPVNLIEDCAVSPLELPDYVKDLEVVLKKHGVQASYYAHAGAGELHIEPIVNLKTTEGQAAFRGILADTVELIKKYNGSLSGEHGDGRLRGEFIPTVLGSETYELLRKVKYLFDPNNIFNAGKVIDTPKMDTHLRVDTKPVPVTDTIFNFNKNGSILRLAEKCSGSGDCRKTAVTGGLMCPSYMATRQEKDTTRARANVLRQYLSGQETNPFDHEEIKEVMDLCLSCKGCKIECPSSVDVAKMKAEFLQHYYDANGVPMRAKLIGNFTKQMKLASIAPGVYNAIVNNDVARRAMNKLIGFHPDRTMPELAKQTLRSWFKGRKATRSAGKLVYLFCDEFTNYNDVEIGKKAIQLLENLGYQVVIPEHLESGRTYLSKGLVRKAAEIANQNVQLLGDLISKDAPLIGIEPSAVLTFRDEYVDLAKDENLEKALRIAKHTFTIEEFIAQEFTEGRISAEQFSDEKRTVAIHGHCYQKSLSSQSYIQTMLSIPANYEVSLIPSGCCGMAGSFGYEEEHYEVSNKIGELVLFPFVRSQPEEVIIAAAGTSCRHQIKDGTSRKAKHPVEILGEAYLPKD
ncbi:FAD-binding protein [Mucilaginibacter daejeonensis]|uniref:FAD-binding and (Fe-S)-binding domain-containing protein n=1 Tax=Mucilaginibacter daejeonensis TaxID=398049 RepID=UPI001D171152|nr:FAD-binding and (Fe-S)-binding domain-containing protein [Mucilaginibacter daejeonensis]UEG52435.1 FAD-binding protein [Mucilaginibacter daejeonensis]